MMALDGSWGELALEMVPYVGDAYSAGKLAKVAPDVFRSIEKLRHRAELAFDAM